jgi:hypothetical protein
LWLPDPDAVIKLLTHNIPVFLGGWGLIGILSASMSTCDGAILAMGTVLSHNVLRNIGGKHIITDTNLLFVARVCSLPMTVISGLIASFYRSNHAAGATGYLLVIAFDIVTSTVIVPLFGCFYTKKPSPLAALCAVLTGLIVRVALEFTLPKDGFIVAPFPGDEFLNYGSAASIGYPLFFDKPTEEVWDPNVEQCDQPRYNDWTGVDSLATPIVAAIVFIFIQFLERNGPIVNFDANGVMAPYLKVTQIKSEISDTERKISELEESGRLSLDDSSKSLNIERKLSIRRASLDRLQKTLSIRIQEEDDSIEGGEAVLVGDTGVKVDSTDESFEEFQKMVNSTK